MPAMADENPEMSPFSSLPEGCIAHIISLTFPRDACRAAAVSVGFKSAAESDTVWERFLPPDLPEIVSGPSSPVFSSTRKELYLLLCDSSLSIDGGKLSFRLIRPTGKKCYMLSAGSLDITWGDTPRCWRWTSLPESRFAEVAEMLSVSWLEVCGIVQAQLLSPRTTYAAFLVFKLSDIHYGLQCSTKASVKFVRESTSEIEGKTNTVYIVPPKFRRGMGRGRWVHLHVRDIDGRIPCTRTDGWLEIELGEIFIAEGDNSEILIQLSETEHLNWKKGLIIEGIELRPKE